MSCNSDKCHCPACIEDRVDRLDDRVSRLERTTPRKEWKPPFRRYEPGSEPRIWYIRAKCGLEAIERKYSKADAMSVVQAVCGAPWTELDQVSPCYYEAIFDRCCELMPLSRAGRVTGSEPFTGYKSDGDIFGPRHVHLLALGRLHGKIHVGSDQNRQAAKELEARGLLTIDKFGRAKITRKGEVMLDAMCRVPEPIPATTEWRMP